MNRLLESVSLFADMCNADGFKQLVENDLKRCVLRGELVVGLDAFREHLSGYPTPRSFIAALAIKKDEAQLHPEVRKAVRVVFYECYILESRGKKRSNSAEAE